MRSKAGIIVLLGACLVASLFIAGCTQSQPATVTQTTTAKVTTAAATEAVTAAPSAAGTPAPAGAAGMANPASVNCGKIGGTTEIRTAADGGQYGMCSFPNGTTCEEWALFRGEGCLANVTAAPSPSGTPVASAGMANPASVNCGKIGGTTDIRTASDGGQYGMCTFPNGTTCEEWALFRGEGCKAYSPAAATNASK